jgi:hypothetical protein
MLTCDEVELALWKPVLARAQTFAAQRDERLANLFAQQVQVVRFK